MIPTTEISNFSIDVELIERQKVSYYMDYIYSNAIF